jgi:hypothetical protein
MSVIQQYEKIQKLIPYIQQKIGQDIEFKADKMDKYWVIDLLKKDKINQDLAIEVFFKNLGREDSMINSIGSAVGHAFHGSTDMTPDTAQNIEAAAKCFRRLGALIEFVKMPGYFKARPVIDTLGDKLFEYSSAKVIEILDPVDLVRLKNEGVI